MDHLEALVTASNPKENALRTNVQKDAQKRTLPNGRKVLAKPIRSQALKAGPIFDAVKKMQPWATQITLNKNFASQANPAHPAPSARCRPSLLWRRPINTSNRTTGGKKYPLSLWNG